MRLRHALWADISEAVRRVAAPARTPAEPVRSLTEPARLSRAELIDLFAADLRAPAAALLPRRVLSPDRAG